MPSYQFDRPIPGQSLTVEPRNAPYERPPEIVDPEEALMVHLTRLNEPEALKGIVDFVEMGVDVVTLTEGILRSAVMNGIHTVDVSLVIAPVIHGFITSALDEMAIKYDEGFDDPMNDEEAMYTRAKVKTASKAMGISQSVKEAKKTPADKYRDSVAKPEPIQEEAQMELPLEAPQEKPMGLMGRM